MLSPLSRRLAVAALIAVLLAGGLWPYWPILGMLPWGSDALKWVGRGALHHQGWEQWVFASKHFVGYRPVTALSFTLNDIVTGQAALGYRATDLGLHLLSGAALFAVHRRLTGDRSVLGLVPVLLVFGHPTTEEIVPYSARRSYLLAAVFGLGAVLAYLEAGRWRSDPLGSRRALAWGTLGAVALGIAVLSNEVAYVLVPLVPWLVGRSGGGSTDWRRVARIVAPTGIVVLGAVIARYVVLGTVGGYSRRFFAFVRKGVPMWIEQKSWQPDDIVAAAWSHTVDPYGVTGAAPLVHGSLLIPFVVAAAVGVAWIGLVRPALRWREPANEVRLVLFAWMIGALAIVVLSQTWFWRQAHGVLLPLGMLLALELGEALATIRSRPWPAVPTVAAIAVVAVAMLWNGPLRGGMQLSPHQNAIEGTPLARRIDRLLDQVGDRSTVWLVAPMRANAGHILRLWGDELGADKHVSFHLLGHLTFNGAFATADVGVERGEDGARLFLGDGMQMAKAPGMPEPAGPEGFLVDRLWRTTTPSWLVAVDATQGWAIRAKEPPLGVEPLPDPGAEDAGDSDE